MFGTALTGRSKERPELADTPMPLSVHLPVLPCRGGEAILRRLFEPLGYEVDAARSRSTGCSRVGRQPLLRRHPRGTVRLRDLLEHLFVLLPVLDDDKHYWVGPDEVDKLLRRGGVWLATHPDRELIARRYLRHDRRLTTDALARLLSEEADDPDEVEAAHDEEEEIVEKPISLNDQRLAAVIERIRRAERDASSISAVGAGKLVQRILRDTKADTVLGVDVSYRALRSPRAVSISTRWRPGSAERVDLVQGALTYRDRRLQGFDAATVIEVIEHLDPPRLGAFEHAVFGSPARRR